MARVTQAQVAQLVPEFAACDPTIAGVIIAWAETQLNPNFPPATINTAECLLVGHFYLITNPQIGQGALVESETAGQVSADYKLPTLAQSPLNTTRYGMLLRMMATNQGYGVGLT